MEAGDYAKTRGVRFQALWAVRQLLLLLAEELRSVRIEPAGTEGEGVDLIVTLPDGRTEYQQCKRSNRQEGKWTLGELSARGVLGATHARLRGDPTATFLLVSIDAAPALRDLAESARASLDPESFLRDQVRASNERLTAFQDFCKSLGLNSERPGDLELARALLRRCGVKRADDDQEELRDLRSQARRWVDGDPGAVVDALETLSLEKLRCEITAADVDAWLSDRGFHPRRLDRDPRIVPALQRLREQFDDSLSGQLVSGRILPRDETVQLEKLVTDPEGPRFIALHGPAGVGKSGVLLEATRRLRAKGIPYLPLRLDRQRPAGTLRQFGERLDLRESPALCLGSVSAAKPAVLLLDQLDALRWTGADAGQALDACRELVKEALGFPGLRVVACCRSFDLEHDPQISTWIEQHQARKLAVRRLAEETVKAVVAGMGVDPGVLTARQVDLLRTIQLLRTWEETLRVTGGAVDFVTERQLLDAFWRSRLLETRRRMEIDSASLQAAVDRIVAYMDREGALVAPVQLLRDQPSEAEALQSLNVVTVAAGTIAFCHQTYLDHQLAHLLLRRLDEGESSLEGWLTSRHQGLFRREQLRLILEMLREEGFDRYLSAVRELLASADLRFHLKQLVLEVLGRVQGPQAGEVEVVLSHLREPAWREHVIADVFLGHPAWFSVAQEADFLVNWLESESGTEREHALSVITSVIDKEGEQCSKLLAPLLDRGQEWSQRLTGVLRRKPAEDSPSIFELRVRLTEEGARWTYLKWKSLGGPDLRWLVRLLSAVLAGLDPEERDRPMQRSHVLGDLEEVPLGGAALEELLRAWKALLPEASRLIGRAEDEVMPVFEDDRGWAADLRAFMRKLAVELVTRDTPATIELVEHDPTRLGELLLLDALPHVAGSEAAERALDWLVAEPRRLRLRWKGSDRPWDVSRPAVERLTRLCSPARCSAFERFLLEFKEPRFREDMEWRHKMLLRPRETLLGSQEPKFSGLVLRKPSTAGSTAHHLLPCLPDERLSDRGRQELGVLTRKFSSQGDIFFAGSGKVQAGWVRSPLPRDRLNLLSDKTWLKIMSDNAAPRGSGWQPGRYRDGHLEKSSPATFSSDLETATSREPGRFARLALRFPPDANPSYFQAVIQGLRGDPQKGEQEEGVTVEELEALLALPQVSADPSLAIAVARLVESRGDLDWGPAALDLVAGIATQHPNPAPGQIQIGDRGDWGPENVTMNALNCTRGAATYAIARLLFADPKRLAAFGPAIQLIVSDSHPAVRAAAFRCCLAVLDDAPSRAIDWALRAAEGHEALLATSDFDHFLFYTCQRHLDDMEPTLQQMLESARADVVRVAASHTVALYLRRGVMEEAARSCLYGPTPKRVGAAEVAAAFAGRPEHSDKAESILLEFINDEEDEVLAACQRAFHDATPEVFGSASDFLETYASSRAFQRNPFTLLHRLQNHAGSLVPFASCILAVCRSLSATASEGDASHQSMSWEGGHYLPGILLRLYEQAQDEEVRETCLDAWDLLLQARVVAAVDLSKELAAEE